MEPSQVPRRAPQSDAEICLAGALVGAEMAKSTNSTEVYDKAAQAYNGLYLNEGASPSAPTSAKLLKDFFTQREKERVLADTCGPPISPAVQAVADQPEPGVTPQATPALAVAGPSVAPPGRKPSAAPPGRKRRPATDAENAASKRRREKSYQCAIERVESGKPLRVATFKSESAAVMRAYLKKMKEQDGSISFGSSKQKNTAQLEVWFRNHPGDYKYSKNA